MAERCDDHAWASVGVTTVDGQVTRIWDCERCVVWTREPLDEADEIDWAETRLSR